VSTNEVALANSCKRASNKSKTPDGYWHTQTSHERSAMLQAAEPILLCIPCCVVLRCSENSPLKCDVLQGVFMY
jgi:hypothetical protein